MNHSLLLAEAMRTPWALPPDYLATLAQVLARWSIGQPASPEILAGVRQDAAARRDRKTEIARSGAGRTAVLPLWGIITPRGNMVDDVSGPGSTSIQQFTGSLRAALADDSIASVLLWIDSPGGSVFGVQELADEIYQARQTKPIVAIADSLAASAAYWIGSQASEFYASPSAEVGSVGVYMMHQDLSKALEDAGVKTTFISAGKYKTEGNPREPLAPEAKAFLQTRIDDYYASFTKAVAKGRNAPIAQVRDGMGQGRALGAPAALAAGMVDGIRTFDQAVRRASDVVSSRSSAGRSTVAMMRRRLDILGTL